MDARTVGVDVTFHKEARHVTDASRAHKRSNARVRYYVELVVGSPRASHTRLGFSGTFKALLRLHGALEALFDAHHARVPRESISSVTSASSASSSASRRRRASTAESGEPLPTIVPFPTNHALLVKLQPRQQVESDAKASARCDALFAYYSQLFNSDERELFLDYIQRSAERYGKLPPSDNQLMHDQQESQETEVTSKRGFLKKLFGGLKRHGDVASDEAEMPRSQRQRAAVLDAKLEFAAPVHVTAKKTRRQM